MNADAFKPLDEVSKEDIRWTFFGGWAEGERIEHRHARIAEITLNDHVPEAIRTQFDVARNLLLYAWYVYRFTTAAELHAYSTLEIALRERAKLEKLYPQYWPNLCAGQSNTVGCQTRASSSPGSDCYKFRGSARCMR